MHSVRAYHKAIAMLHGHDFGKARLYHLGMTDEISGAYSEKPDRLLKMIKRITRKLNHIGVKYRWRACFEHDLTKSHHMHVFFLVEDTSEAKNPDEIFNTTPTNWLRKTFDKHVMGFSINKPKNSIHWTSKGKQKNYALISTPEKLDDCKHWISYLVKKRSKLEVGQVYFSSKDSIKKGIKNDD